MEAKKKNQVEVLEVKKYTNQHKKISAWVQELNGGDR